MSKIFLYLLYRETKLKFRWKPIIIGQVMVPAAYFLFFGIAFSYNLKTFEYFNYNINYVVFLLPGIIIMQTFVCFNIIGNMVANEKRYGVFKLLMISQSTPIDYVMSKITIEAIIVLFQSLMIIFLGCIIIPELKDMIFFKKFILILIILILATLFWGSLGIIWGLILPQEEKRSLFFTLINYPILFCSNIFYNIERMPLLLKKISLINPLTHFVDIIRKSMFTGNLPFKEFIILIIITFLILNFSIFLVKKTPL